MQNVAAWATNGASFSARDTTASQAALITTLFQYAIQGAGNYFESLS